MVSAGRREGEKEVSSFGREKRRKKIGSLSYSPLPSAAGCVANSWTAFLNWRKREGEEEPAFAAFGGAEGTPPLSLSLPRTLSHFLSQQLEPPLLLYWCADDLFLCHSFLPQRAPLPPPPLPTTTPSSFGSPDREAERESMEEERSS